MRLNDASIVIRPRPAWEALDLGILLARQHRALLMGTWALVTLPILGLLSLLLWEHPGAVMLLFWWLKPLYERLPLLILSRALFGDTPTLTQALKAWPATLKHQWLPSLLWRRLSLIRSFTLPVQQLEGLAGEERARRLGVLCQADMRAARWLTVAGAHLEMILYAGLLLLLYAFVPRQMDLGWSWLGLLEGDGGTLWFDHLLNLLYALVLIVWAPVYVACGFMLYLNRRTRLEAWDIEQVLRRLRQRLAATVASLALGAGLTLACLCAPAPAWAATASEPGPDSPRLSHQPLDSQQSRQAIEALLAQAPFHNQETVSGWRLADTPDTPHANDNGHDTRWLAWLNRLLQGASSVAGLIEWLLWALVIGLGLLLAWHYRHWLVLLGPARQPPAPTAGAPAVQLFGLAVDEHSLPDDVAGSARALWAQQPRQALSLLYRALLSRLISEYRLPLTPADTEGQVLERIASLEHPALLAFSQELTRHWQHLAYGHRLPGADVQQRLCDGWSRLFDRGVKA